MYIVRTFKNDQELTMMFLLNVKAGYFVEPSTLEAAGKFMTMIEMIIIIWYTKFMCSVCNNCSPATLSLASINFQM